MKKNDLIKYLDKYLNIKEFEDIDGSKNGLQIDNSKDEIKKIGYAVDANTYIFDLAVQNDCDMLITHHGLFRGEEQLITGINYQRISRLIKNDICLYGCHLPLDAHPEVGNNIGLIKAFINVFGLKNIEIQDFGLYHGKNIGYGIKFDHEIHVNSIIDPYCKQMQLENKFYNFGNKIFIKSIAIISGAAGDDALQANQEGYDLYITGEFKRSSLVKAKELGQSIFACGHRETEKIGVKLLANNLTKTFGIETLFLDKKF